MTEAPFAIASLPCSSPPFWMRSTSQVAARAVPVQTSVIESCWETSLKSVPHGKHAAGTPSKKRVPLTPLGPSVVLIAGIPSLCTDAVCQKSVPEMREIFSAVVSFSSTSSTSKSFAMVEPFNACFSGNEAAGILTAIVMFCYVEEDWKQNDQKRMWMCLTPRVRRGHGKKVRLIRKLHEADAWRTI